MPTDGSTAAPPAPPTSTGPTGATTLTDPLIGLLVDGRYRILSRLARGGMATVYVAEDERLDRPVALKVMHPHLAESTDFVSRFRREARAAARIVHPGVVSVFDQGVVHGQGFLVMELIEGPNLRTLLRSQGAFTVSQALRYTQEVLEALQAAHRAGVIHRDIKPENVLVPAEGPVRVTDFGLARAASEVSMSTTGSMLGTVAYMAPEIATTGTTDARTDIYSVGIMLDEMLTGRVPWDGESPIRMAYSHVHDDIPLPSRDEPWIPREVDDLVAALAARDPDERPADTREALELVARTRASLPAEIAHRRAAVVPTVGSPASTSTMTAAITPGTATSPLPGHVSGPVPTASTSQVVVHASGSVPAAPARGHRSGVRTLLVLLVVLLLAGGGGGWWWWAQYGPGSYVEMPVVAGRNAAAATSDLQAVGLASTTTEEFSDTVASGVVIDSDPVGGQAVHKDVEVKLVVSKGVDMRTVPDVVGDAEADARTALSDVGLSVGTVSQEYSEDVQEGLVISQSEDPGTSLPHDTAVDLTVSRGREPIAVPDLTGKSGDEAAQALDGLGLVSQPSEAFSDTVEKGVVISQTTAAGSTLHRGDPVDYVVSKGPEMVEVPEVIGKQLDEARRALEDQGFQVSVERILGGYFGTVRQTDPAGGTSVPKGSTVTVTVI